MISSHLKAWPAVGLVMRLSLVLLEFRHIISEKITIKWYTPFLVQVNHPVQKAAVF